MASIDRDLVRAINTGRCFALVGSGASCEIGLPSWHNLATTVISLLDLSLHQQQIKRCQQLLSQKNYPAIFSIIEKEVGIIKLLKYIESQFPISNVTGKVYSFISRWPFAVYLTTNYDDLLNKHLQDEGLSFANRLNSKSDFRTLRANAKGITFKIHGDCSAPDDIVLTQEQYKTFRESKEREYWREKIRSVLHMVDLVMIGYSASDPDFRDQLELAKDLASPDHPIFMFAAEVNTQDIRKYYLEFNIRIVPYSNDDGKHSDLHRALNRYDPFIAKREASHLGQEPIDEEKANLASSIFLFTRLSLLDGNDSCLKKSYEALILSTLGNFGPTHQISLQDLQSKLSEKLHSTHTDPYALKEGLDSLYSHGFIEIEQTSKNYMISQSGSDAFENTKAERKLANEKFRKSCRLFIEKEYVSLDTKTQDEVIRQLDEGLVRAFEKRGAEMAQATFGQNTIDLSTATDILEVVNNQSSRIKNESARSAFADLLLEIILQPTTEMRDWLAHLSQGYFSYHALGLDPQCTDERLRLAKEKVWILDSSIILPLIAKHCPNHMYAMDLLDKMKALGLKLYTTGRLFDEVIDHAVWAIKNFKNANSDSPSLLQVSSGGPGYKQNLFIDGYMKWAIQQGSASLDKYFRFCLGEDYEKNTFEHIEEKIRELNIDIVDFSQWPFFRAQLWGDRLSIEDKIIELRNDRGTFRNRDQCRAEAEVLILCENQKAGFLSQSSILDYVDRSRPRITWKPESMYRFLSTFSSVPPSEDLLYQSMVQDFFYSGFDIVNRDVLKQYFAVPVRQSRLNLDEEKENYEKTLGGPEFRKIRDGFEKVPDFKKPFYSMQTAFYVARKESEIRAIAETRANQAEQTKALNEEERKNYDRLRAKQAERKRKNLKQKRRAQSQKGKSKYRKK